MDSSVCKLVFFSSGENLNFSSVMLSPSFSLFLLDVGPPGLIY